MGKRKRIFFWGVMLLLTTGLVRIALAGKAVPQAAEFHYTDSEQKPLTAGELTDAQKYSGDPFTCTTSQVETVRTPSGASETVIAVYTDPMYPGIYPFTWTAGHFWAEGNGAVISRRTAEALFCTPDALGAVVQVDGISYTITGIYDSAPMGRSFGPERLFLPIGPEMPVTLLAFSGDRSAAYYMAGLPWEIGSRLVGYAPVLLKQEWNVISMILRVLILILAAGILFRLCKWTFARVGALAEGWRATMRDCYLKEALWRNRKKLLPALAGAGGILLAAGTIWWAVSSPPPLPADYLQDNLFNLPGYLELFRQRQSLLRIMQNPTGGYYLYFVCESVRRAVCLSGGMLLAAGLRPKGGDESRKGRLYEKGTSDCKMQ